MNKLNVILVSKIHFKITVDEYIDLCHKVAGELTDKSLFNWKIWMIDRENKFGATVYYLETEEQVNTVEDYMNTMALLYTELVHKVELEKYEIMDTPTKMNYGPINYPSVEIPSATMD